MTLNPSRRRFVQSGAALVGSAALPQLSHAIPVPINRGQPKAAAGQVRAFLEQLKAIVRRGDLSPEAAAPLQARGEALHSRL